VITALVIGYDPGGEDAHAVVCWLDASGREGRIVERPLQLDLHLTVPIEAKSIVRKPVPSIGAGALVGCLAPEIAAAGVEPLGLGILAWREQLSAGGNRSLAIGDCSFAGGVAKTNLTPILQ